jgi:two-component system response regulator
VLFRLSDFPAAIGASDMVNSVFTDIMRTADTDHEIYFLLTSYIEAVRFNRRADGVSSEITRLPLHGKDDVKERFAKLLIELDLASKGLDAGRCELIREALHILGTAWKRLESLAAEGVAAQGHAVPDAGGARGGAREPVDVLLVEDNPYDVRMARKALDVTGAPYHLHVVKDGGDALAYLCQAGQFDAAPKPDVVLIDLSIPQLDAQEVLDELKASDTLRHVPVVALTCSVGERHAHGPRRVAADHFVIKPLGFEAFADEMKKVDVLAARSSGQGMRL